MRLQILRPLRVWRGGVELDPGPQQQAHLRALLLALEGRPISTEELIDLIWDQDAPASARNVIHKYVGSLRRLLEPMLQVRATGSYLLRRGSGYLCMAGPDVLDLARFRELVASAHAGLPDQQVEVALDALVEALRLWSGPAGDGLLNGPAASSVFAGLDGEFLDLCRA